MYMLFFFFLISYLFFLSICFTLEGIHYKWISGEGLDGLGASERLGCLVADGLRGSDQEHIFGLLIQQKDKKENLFPFILYCIRKQKSFWTFIYLTSVIPKLSLVF